MKALVVYYLLPQLASSDLPDAIGAFVARLHGALVPEPVRGPGENTRAASK